MTNRLDWRVIGELSRQTVTVEDIKPRFQWAVPYGPVFWGFPIQNELIKPHRTIFRPPLVVDRKTDQLEQSYCRHTIKPIDWRKIITTRANIVLFPARNLFSNNNKCFVETKYQKPCGKEMTCWMSFIIVVDHFIFAVAAPLWRKGTQSD